MQNQQQSIQGILSIAALICLAVGWFNLFSPEINHLLSRKVFYVLIGASFFIQAPSVAFGKTMALLFFSFFFK